jgi:hypothetical protein
MFIWINRSSSICKSTTAERRLVNNIVATFSIERIPEQDIIDEIYNQAKKTIDSLLSKSIKNLPV